MFSTIKWIDNLPKLIKNFSEVLPDCTCATSGGNLCSNDFGGNILILVPWVECCGIGLSISGEVVDVLGVHSVFVVCIPLRYNSSSKI